MLLETAHPKQASLADPSNKEDMTKGILSASNRLTQGPFRALRQLVHAKDPRDQVVEFHRNSN